MPESDQSRLQRGILWNFLAVAFNQGSTFVVNILVARLLGASGFGEFAIASSTLLTLSILGQLSLGYTATKYIAELRSTDRARTERILAFCSLGTLLMAALAVLFLLVAGRWVASTLLQAPQLVMPLLAGSGFLFFSIINGYQMGALAGFEAYRRLALAGVFSALLAVTGTCLGAWFWGLPGAMAGLSVTAGGRWFVHKWQLRNEMAKLNLVPAFGKARTEYRVFLDFALPAVLGGVIYLPISWLASAFLVRQPDGFVQMAFFASCTSLRMLVLFLPNVINTVGLSLLNDVQGQTGRYRRISTFTLGVMVGTALLAAVALALFGKPVLRLFGESFTGAYPLLLVLVISTIPESLYLALYQQLNVHGKMWLSLLGIIVPWQLTFGALAWLLIPRNGALGLGAAYLLASFVQVAVTAVYVQRLAKTDPSKQPLEAKLTPLVS